MGLVQIQADIAQRVNEIEAAHSPWPCRKGCDDCCRSLAAQPMVTRSEWELIAHALQQLPPETAAALTVRIRESGQATRPVTCPLLDLASGSCSIYDARPIACRTYGFYAERQFVLGCWRIKDLSEMSPGIVWGNQAAVESRLSGLGETSDTLANWLALDNL